MPTLLIASDRSIYLELLHPFMIIMTSFPIVNKIIFKDRFSWFLSERYRGLFPVLSDHGFGYASCIPCRGKTMNTNCYSYEDESVLSKSNKKQLDSLDHYFGRLHDSNNTSLDPLIEKTVVIDPSTSNLLKGKRLLDVYFGKVTKGVEAEESETYVKRDIGKNDENILKSYRNLRNNNLEGGFQSSYDEASDLYVISILTSINIAVFLFEIASPIQNSDSELFFTLPSLYGAKVNDLIMTGEWWRLVTPMFLHSGILHIAHGFWVLLNFGPRVCKFYGSFTFFLIYVLGGISGNLTSFLQTPEPSVGGTGPVFAIIGAWLIYHIQNKDNILNDDFEIMYQKAIIATAIGSVLSTSGPIDNWTHLGATFTGIIYGFLMLQINHTSPKTSQKEGIALVTPVANPWKSLLVFFLFIIGFFSLLFVVEPPLN